MKGALFWITGLSGAGKTSISNALNNFFKSHNIYSTILDGDNVRKILGEESKKDYSFSSRKKIAEIYSRLGQELVKQNHIVIVSTISMFQNVRDWNRNNIQNYFEVYLKVDFKELNKRDPKSLYLSNKEDPNAMVSFEGDSVYEEPKSPDLVVDTSKCSIDEAINEIIKASKVLNSLKK